MEKNKLIITIAQTGSVPTRENSPYAPLTPKEIVKDIVDCYDRGAVIAHTHARDENEKPSHKLQYFKQIFDELDKTGCPIIRQISTTGRQVKDFKERCEALDLLPPSCSFTTGSVNFANFIYENSPQLIQYFAERMYELKVKPEIEIFDTGMIQPALDLRKKGLLKDPLQFNFVMGIKGAMAATAKNLLHCLDMIPEGSLWQVSVVGDTHTQISTIAIALGGNVRVGVEDNIWYDREKGIKASNTMLMDRILGIAKAYGRELATVEEAREILKLEN